MPTLEDLPTLDELPVGNLATDDLIPVWDVSTRSIRKVRVDTFATDAEAAAITAESLGAATAESVEALKQGIITVADATARKDAASYAAGVLITGVTKVVQSDLPFIVWFYLNGDVTADASWFGTPYTNSPDGDIIITMELADVTGTVPDANVLVMSGGVPSFGDGVTENGNPLSMRWDNLFTLVGIGSAAVEVKDWETVPAATYEYSSVERVSFGYRVKHIGASAFSYTSITSGVLRLPPLLETIGNDAFNGSVFDEVQFNERLISIGNSALADLGGSSFHCTLPASLETIGASAFLSTTFASLTLNDGLLTIGSNAFSNCTISPSQDLVIPDSVTSVGATAFDGATGIANAYCNIAIANFPTSALGNTGAGTLYVHSAHFAGYGATHGSKAVAEWTSYPDPM